MKFEEWFRKTTPMSDHTFEEIIKDTPVYKSMKRAYEAGYILGYAVAAYDYHPCSDTKKDLEAINDCHDKG